MTLNSGKTNLPQIVTLRSPTKLHPFKNPTITMTCSILNALQQKPIKLNANKRK